MHVYVWVLKISLDSIFRIQFIVGTFLVASSEFGPFLVSYFIIEIFSRDFWHLLVAINFQSYEIHFGALWVAIFENHSLLIFQNQFL